MFKDIQNNIDFYLRNKTKFSRKNYIENDIDILKRIRDENVYIKEVLLKYFKKRELDNLKALDIGCKNWYYVRGEYSFFDEFSENFSLDGVEIDAYRLYGNLFSRYEAAKYFTKGFKNVNYIADNLLNINDKYDYIIWILPFVIEDPHKMWGLPERIYYPEKLLAHAYSLLNNKGQMLIINQGEFESKVQEEFLKSLNIEYRFLGEIESRSFKYKYKRYGFLVVKN